MLIGVDEGLLRWPRQEETVLLTPGERIDVVIHGNRNPGTELAKLQYEPGVAEPCSISNRLSDVSPLTDPRFVRRFDLGPPFTINGRRFDANRIDTRVRLGTSRIGSS